MEPITPYAVIATAEAATKLARERLVNDEELCHMRGYHAYATELANLRFAIEQAMSRLADNLMED